MDKKKIAAIHVERLERIISQIPQSTSIENSVIAQYHELVKDLSDEIGKDYSKYNIPESEHRMGHDWNFWNSVPVKTRIYDLAGTLKMEYDVGKQGLGEALKSKLTELIGKLTWQIILMLLGVCGLVLGTIIISRLGI